jgi:hypothetical protein
MTSARWSRRAARLIAPGVSLRDDCQRVGRDCEFHDVQIPDHRHSAGNGFGRAGGQGKGGEHAQEYRDRQSEFCFHAFLYSNLYADQVWKRLLTYILYLKHSIRTNPRPGRTRV